VPQTVAVWIVVLLAFSAANLPFVSNRLMAVMVLRKPKTLWLRLAELLVFYFIVGGIGLVLEQRAGQIAPQTWDFYAITAALFLTFTFPGFVYCYLFKRHG
jgi:Protein of unknown function (DUF2818)